jgi:hypothetical protein
MNSFETEFDIGTYGKEDYDVIQCTVEFTILPGDTGLWTYSNGDPGYPPTGDEIDYLEVYDENGKNITKEVPEKWIEKFEEMCYEKHDKDK